MQIFKKLSRSEMKNVLGGYMAAGCSCTLTASGGQSATIPIGGTATDTDSCSAACKKACAGANEVGGNCDKYKSTYTAAA